MPSIQRSALLPYSQERVFALINDIERYPEFLSWVKQAEVQSSDAAQMVASLTVGSKGISERLTTRNRLQPPSRIDLELVSGALEDFKGSWLITALGDAGCKVELDVRFQFAGRLRLLAMPFNKRINRLADKVMDAFCERAAQVCDGI